MVQRLLQLPAEFGDVREAGCRRQNGEDREFVPAQPGGERLAPGGPAGQALPDGGEDGVTGGVPPWRQVRTGAS